VYRRADAYQIVSGELARIHFRYLHRLRSHPAGYGLRYLLCVAALGVINNHGFYEIIFHSSPVSASLWF
jgi:hypothetical protein